jgi:hypothetical protein
VFPIVPVRSPVVVEVKSINETDDGHAIYLYELTEPDGGLNDTEIEVRLGVNVTDVIGPIGAPVVTENRFNPPTLGGANLRVGKIIPALATGTV